MNNWKGRITESLTRFYIRDVLCPKLEKEGWFKVLFLPSIPLLIPSRPIEELSAGKRDFYRDKYISLRTILLGKGIYPSQEFLEKCGRVNDFLKHLSDGILLILEMVDKPSSIEKRNSEDLKSGDLDSVGQKDTK